MSITTARPITPQQRAGLLRTARGERRTAVEVPMGVRVVNDATPPTETKQDESPLSLDQVLERAQASESVRIQALGAKVSALLADLTERVRAEAVQAQQRAAVEKARQELAEKEQALTQELANVRQQLRETKGAGDRASAAVDVDAKAVRTWAAANGVQCSSRGRPARQVIDQWRAATSAEAVR